MDETREFQLRIFAASPGNFFPVRRRRPLRSLGRLWTVQCGVGQLCPLYGLHGQTQLVFAGRGNPTVSCHCHVFRNSLWSAPGPRLEGRLTSVLSGLLLISFALTMTIALGVKAPLNFSVFSAAGGALLLAARETFPFSVDELLRRNTPGKWSARSASSRVPDRKDLLHINMHLCIIAWECAYAGKALGRNRCRRRWLESHPEPAFGARCQPSPRHLRPSQGKTHPSALRRHRRRRVPNRRQRPSPDPRSPVRFAQADAPAGVADWNRHRPHLRAPARPRESAGRAGLRIRPGGDRRNKRGTPAFRKGHPFSFRK